MNAGRPEPSLPGRVTTGLLLAPFAALTVAGLVLLNVVVFNVFERQLTTDHTTYEVVEARVSRTETFGTPPHDATAVRVSYEVDGRRYDDVRIAAPDSFYEGLEVELLYPPEDPEDVILRSTAESSWAWSGVAVAVLLDLTVLAFAVWFGASAYRSRRGG